MERENALQPPRDTLGRGLNSLRVSVTDRCNFRCPYCMPAAVFGANYRFLPRAEILSFEEIERLVRVFARLGVNKVRLTGGEPTVRAEIGALVSKISRVPGIEDLALTTNGSRLAALAAPLKAAGLSRVTVSLDSLDPAVFEKMNGVGASLDAVLTGIEAARAAGLTPVKLNCVVVRGENDAGIVELARKYRGTGVTVRFIEFMDVGNENGWKRDRVFPASEIASRISAVFPLVEPRRDAADEVSETYRYADGAGEIGIIASVTRPFCGGCTRARLSAEGRLITCLFAETGPDLKAPLRAGATDEEMETLIGGIWQNRNDRYSEERALAGAPGRKIEMFQVGG